MDRSIQQALIKFALDNLPILLSSRDVASGPRSFRFFNALCREPELNSVVKKVWEEIEMRIGSFWG